MSPQHLTPSSRSSRHQRRESEPISSPVQEITLTNPEAICKELASGLGVFDFDRFFKVFDIDSPMCRFIESFSLSSFRDLMDHAFTPVSPSERGSPGARAVMKAQRRLDDELRDIDTLLGIMAREKLDVQGVRDSLNWVRSVNRRALDSADVPPPIYAAPPPPTLAAPPPPPPSLYSRAWAGTLYGDHATSSSGRLPVSQGPNTPQRSRFDKHPSSPSSPHHSDVVPYWERWPRSPVAQSPSKHRSRHSLSAMPTHNAAVPTFSSGSGRATQGVNHDLSGQRQAYNFQWHQR